MAKVQTKIAPILLENYQLHLLYLKDKFIFQYTNLLKELIHVTLVTHLFVLQMMNADQITLTFYPEVVLQMEKLANL